YLAEVRQLDEARERARALGAEEALAAFETLYREAAARVLHLEEALAQAQSERRQLAAEMAAREDARPAPIKDKPQPTTALSGSAAPAVGPPPRADLASQVRRLEKKLTAALAERDRALAEAARVSELGEEVTRLRDTVQSLRELRARELGKAAAALRQHNPPSTATPLVAPPRRAGPGGTPRVGVFIDAANLAGAARRIYERSVDFRRLLPALVSGRRLVEARAYTIDKGDPGFAAFAQALREAGYKVMSKKPRTFDDGTMKADWDVGMVVEILSLSDKLDVVALGSGDGDFLPLVSALKQAGLRVELAAFRERAAGDLVRAADSVLELDASFLES
ncbi:MAG: NYN domain-containing protein, partial [Deltaproteobacteria bacterium]|nr:NYN domain-containing protein [Deltaproteobacteria bacterium]